MTRYKKDSINIQYINITEQSVYIRGWNKDIKVTVLKKLFIFENLNYTDLTFYKKKYQSWML